MKKIIFSIFLLIINSSNAFASSVDEINHLLMFVEATPCEYERNGDRHKGSEAKKHIQKKYDYYMDDINSAEDFIQYAATKSAMSGNKYKIHCPNKEVQFSKDWLLAELKSYRERLKLTK